MHASYVLACTGPYLSQIGSDQKHQGIYGIGRTCWTCLITYDPGTQASVHAYYVLACKGPYLGLNGSDERD